MSTDLFEVGAFLEVDVTGMTSDGDGLCMCDGQELHIFGALPGERLQVEILRRQRDYWFGQAAGVVDAAPYREEPQCVHYGTCTGCQWQHIAYWKQLELKAELVKSVIRGVGLDKDVVRPTLAADVPWNYRNHARFSIRRDGSVGFVHREMRRFVRLDSCKIMHPWINGTLSAIQSRCIGMSQASVRYGINTGSWLIQPKLGIQGLELESGQKYYSERFQGHLMRIAASSFFQVNIPQADKLISTVLRQLNPDGKQVVVDAYAGVGTFAVALSGHVGKIIAIEESASAIQDARCNIEGLSNVELIQSKVENALSSFSPAPDAVILDPPRAGCFPDVLKALGQYAPDKVIYVSCDPGTMARDLEILCRHGFHVVEVQPVDMFPQTHRVECAALLKRSEHSWPAADSRLVLASLSPRRRELLSCLGIPFETVAAAIDEKGVLSIAGTPGKKAERAALAKARHAAQDCPARIVIAGDTLVIDGDQILGKPLDKNEAREMLTRLRGKVHGVVTGIAVVTPGGKELSIHVVTRVGMRQYSDEEIDAYVASGDCLDKAGSYGVQNTLFRPAENVFGCYLNVVGLPLCALAKLLASAGVTIPARANLPDSCLDCVERTLPAV